MENETWYDCFLDILWAKFPKRSQLTPALVKLLCIEREAIYRRLRKDVIFPMHEIVKIASAWNLSLDEIVGQNSDKVPFVMYSMNYLNPSEQDVQSMQQYIQIIDQLKKEPDGEILEVCNKLPQSLYAGYTYLNQFYLFRWKYLYGNKNHTIPFSKVLISAKKHQLTKDYCRAIKNVPNTDYVWDSQLFDYLVCNIQYFHSIQMITDEEKKLIKGDLHALLDYMSEVANTGCYPETQNKVNLYISQLNVDTNYSYIYANNTKVCFINAFEKFEIHTFDAKMVSNFKTWMQFKKRTSSQISEVDEKSRIGFFAKQRELADRL